MTEHGSVVVSGPAHVVASRRTFQVALALMALLVLLAAIATMTPPR